MYTYICMPCTELGRGACGLRVCVSALRILLPHPVIAAVKNNKSS